MQQLFANLSLPPSWTGWRQQGELHNHLCNPKCSTLNLYVNSWLLQVKLEKSLRVVMKSCAIINASICSSWKMFCAWSQTGSRRCLYKNLQANLTWTVLQRRWLLRTVPARQTRDCQVKPGAWQEAKKHKDILSGSQIRLGQSYSWLPCRLRYSARCLARNKSLSSERNNWQPGRRPVADRLGTHVLWAFTLLF